jgi:hypothetical protein
MDDQPKLTTAGLAAAVLVREEGKAFLPFDSIRYWHEVHKVCVDFRLDGQVVAEQIIYLTPGTVVTFNVQEGKLPLCFSPD